MVNKINELRDCVGLAWVMHVAECRDVAVIHIEE